MDRTRGGDEWLCPTMEEGRGLCMLSRVTNVGVE